MELLDGGSAALVGGDHLHLHDLDAVGAGAVASTHVTVCGGEVGATLLTNGLANTGESGRSHVTLTTSLGSVSYWTVWKEGFYNAISHFLGVCVCVFDRVCD